jgi:hypothetical protein
MTELKADVLVLGAGMVGVSAALHLQQRGRNVVLIDKHERAGEETSYGNAGLIECASVFPYMFPRNFGQILKYALNRSPDVHYHINALPSFLPWMVRYFLNSSPAGALRSAMAALPLIQRSLSEHEALIAEADVPQLLRRTGWIKLFRSDASMARSIKELERDRASRGTFSTPPRSLRASRICRAISPGRSIGRLPASFPIRAASPRPMPRCSFAKAAASLPPTPGPSTSPATDGVSQARMERSPRVTLSWPWGRGRTRYSSRLDTTSR